MMDFYQRIGIVCNRIPMGKVATYGQISRLCGVDRHARQVGYALSRGLAGDVPAYRVVNHQGVLSGASSFPTATLQSQLLAQEGITVANNRINLKAFGWQTTPLDVIELNQMFEALGI